MTSYNLYSGLYLTDGEEYLLKQIRELEQENENLRKELDQLKIAFRDFTEYRERVL